MVAIFHIRGNFALVYGGLENESKDGTQSSSTVFQYSSTLTIRTKCLPRADSIENHQNVISSKMSMSPSLAEQERLISFTSLEKITYFKKTR